MDWRFRKHIWQCACGTDIKHNAHNSDIGTGHIWNKSTVLIYIQKHSAHIYTKAQCSHIYKSTVLTHIQKHSAHTYTKAQCSHIYKSTVLTFTKTQLTLVHCTLYTQHVTFGKVYTVTNTTIPFIFHNHKVSIEDNNTQATIDDVMALNFFYSLLKNAQLDTTTTQFTMHRNKKIMYHLTR